MREGEIILANLPQADDNFKLRPVLLLKQLPGYNDLLVCGHINPASSNSEEL
jgi:mRNA interferase MazF